MAHSHSFFKRSLASAIAAASITAAATNASATTTNLVNFSQSSWSGKASSIGNFGAGYGADFTVDLVDGALTGEASGDASIQLFGLTIPIVGLDADVNINDSSSDGGSMAAEIVGTTVFEKSFEDGFVYDPSELLTNYESLFCHSFFDVSTTIVIVVVPVTMAAGANGCANLIFSATPQYNTTTHEGTLNLNVTPQLEVELTASVGVGSRVFSAGVEANVTLLDFSIPIVVNPIYNFNTHSFSYGTSGTITLEMLSGSVDLFAKVDLGFWDKTYSYTLFDWEGISKSWTLWAKGKPSASNLTLTIAGETAKASYTYSDTANLAEGYSAITFYRNSTASDTGRTELFTYVAHDDWNNARLLDETDAGQYLKFCLTPKNSNGTTGDQACSDWSSVGKLAMFYPYSSFGDHGYSGTGHLAIAYENVSYGTCFNMADYYARAEYMTPLSMDNQISSYKLYAPTDSSAVFHFFKGADCTDSSSGNYSRDSAAAGGNTQRASTGNLGSDWDNQISSFMVTLGEAVTAENVAISFSGNTATASYDFSIDNNTFNTTESGSTYVWYRASNSTGGGSTVITGSTSSTYTLSAADDQKYLKVCVTPSNGYVSGSQVCSGWSAVAHLVKLWDNTNYTGAPLAIAWEKSVREKCFNMSDYGFNDKASSYSWNNNTVANSTVWFYKDANCGGPVVTRTVTNGGSESLTSIGATMGGAWDNSISSFKVSWNSPVNVSTPTISISGNEATESHTYSGGGLSESATYTWYRATDASGTGAVTLNNFNDKTYALTGGESNKYLKVCVLSSNGVVLDESAVCSSWTAVGPMLQLWSNSTGGELELDIAYERSTSGTCFNMSDFTFGSESSTFEDLASSLVVNAPTSGTARAYLYKDENCTGPSTYVNHGGSISSISGTMNDAISSVKVVY